MKFYCEDVIKQCSSILSANELAFLSLTNSKGVMNLLAFLSEPAILSGIRLLPLNWVAAVKSKLKLRLVADCFVGEARVVFVVMVLSPAPLCLILRGDEVSGSVEPSSKSLAHCFVFLRRSRKDWM